jgi:hypothetical protein
LWIHISNSGIQKMSYWGQKQKLILKQTLLHSVVVWFYTVCFYGSYLYCKLTLYDTLHSVKFVFNAQVAALELFLQGLFNKLGFLACNIRINQAFYFSVGGSCCSRDYMQHDHLFRVLKWHSGFYWFHSNEKVETAISEQLRIQESDFRHNRIFKLMVT